jgi:peroxidase
LLVFSKIQAGGPYWEVLLGRYDSLSASQQDANNDIPAPFDNVNTLTQNFANVGLSINDLVALSGTKFLLFT